MTPNKRDLKAYVRFDGTGRIVAGSLVLARTKPKNGTWKEIEAYECCNPPTSCTEPLLLSVLPIISGGDEVFRFGMSVSNGNTVSGTIEWGDGTSETFDFSGTANTYYLIKYYLNPNNTLPTGKTIKVFFNSTAGFQNLEIGSGDVLGEILSVSNLPTVFAGSTIKEVDFDNQQYMSALDVHGLPLENIFGSGCNSFGGLNVTGCTNLKTIAINLTFGLTSVDFSTISSLEYIDMSSNNTLQNVDPGFLINTYFIDFSGNQLTQTSVDNIIVSVYDNTTISGGYLGLSGGTNAAPSGGYVASAIAGLISSGWSVYTN
jgi:hypothetical protein